jgi:hypothetical protein
VVWVVLIVALTSLAGQEVPAAKTPEPARPASQAQGQAPARPAAPAKKETAKATKTTTPAGAKAAQAKKQALAPPAAARPGADLGVRVLTQAEMRKPRSPFLLTPGEEPGDRYSPDETDWYELPAWRRASFFGIRARGQFFVYVVDCSLSMLDDDRLPRATIELRRSVFALEQPQKFEVIFYNNESIPMPGGPVPRTADLQAKNLLLSWIRLIEPDGGTEPRPALKQALALRPDAVFLLSDGEFPAGTVGEVARMNTRKIPIHCVDLTGGLAGDHLKRIAAGSGGRYASKPGDLHSRP